MTPVPERRGPPSVAPEPAIRSYFFGKGLADLRNTVAESWSANRAASSRYLAAADAATGGDYGENLVGAFWMAAGLAVLPVGAVVVLAVSALHAALLGLFFVGISAIFSVLFVAERLYLGVRRFYATCPHCHERLPLPAYRCPGCRAVHRRLVPGAYGVLRRTCRCGTKLPTSFFLGRGRLESQCGMCAASLHRVHSETRHLCVAIVGGPSVGKSAYLVALTGALVRRWFPGRAITPSFVHVDNRAEYRRAQAAADAGRLPDKTQATVPRAFTFVLERRGARRLLSLYDPAGEAFHSLDRLVEHRFLGYVSGAVFLVDPFQIDEVRLQYGDALAAAGPGLRPSRDRLDETLARVLLGLEQHHGLGATARISWPLAVVVGKADAFDLERRLTPATIPPGTAAADATSDHIRRQLLAWGEASFVQHLEARFARVRYFRCSALGRSPAGDGEGPFVPRGVVAPVRWILQTADRGFGFGEPARPDGGAD